MGSTLPGDLCVRRDIFSVKPHVLEIIKCGGPVRERVGDRTVGCAPAADPTQDGRIGIGVERIHAAGFLVAIRGTIMVRVAGLGVSACGEFLGVGQAVSVVVQVGAVIVLEGIDAV